MAAPQNVTFIENETVYKTNDNLTIAYKVNFPKLGFTDTDSPTCMSIAIGLSLPYAIPFGEEFLEVVFHIFRSIFRDFLRGFGIHHAFELE